jgi:hypothetical protein
VVNDPAEYRWSSYGCNAWGKSDLCVKEHSEYSALGANLAQRMTAYRQLFRITLDPEVLDDIRLNLNQCPLLHRACWDRPNVQVRFRVGEYSASHDGAMVPRRILNPMETQND